ncbi:MAG: hypothetical protein SV487_08605 [Thermodesulfobacteriota bacterium]|nr:hypothetical protein [Thermodesulfobacteriota bacterium]
MRGVITISLVTLKESVRNKLFIGLLIFIGLFLLFSIYVSTLSLGTVTRFIQNTGMLGISLVCLAVSILFGLFSLYQEKDRNELYVLLNRVPRSSYLIGRFLGTSYIIALFALFAGIGVFLVIWLFGHQLAPKVFWAVYWAVLEFSMLTAIGFLFYSMGVGFTLNSLMVLGTFVVGHSMTEGVQSFISLGRFGSETHLFLVKAIAVIFPNFDMFDFRLAIVHNEVMPLDRIGLSTLYWLLYLVALLAAGSVIMSRKDT